MDPNGKAPAPTPQDRRDARKGYLPSDDLPPAGIGASGYAPRSFLSGKSLDGSRGAFSLEAEGMEYESDPPDIDDESIHDPGAGPLLDPLEDSVECCIVATSLKSWGFLVRTLIALSTTLTWRTQSLIPAENPGPPVAHHRALAQAECTTPLAEVHAVRAMTFAFHPRKPWKYTVIRRLQVVRER